MDKSAALQLAKTIAQRNPSTRQWRDRIADQFPDFFLQAIFPAIFRLKISRVCRLFLCLFRITRDSQAVSALHKPSKAVTQRGTDPNRAFFIGWIVQTVPLLARAKSCPLSYWLN